MKPKKTSKKPAPKKRPTKKANPTKQIAKLQERVSNLEVDGELLRDNLLRFIGDHIDEHQLFTALLHDYQYYAQNAEMEVQATAERLAWNKKETAEWLAWNKKAKPYKLPLKDAEKELAEVKVNAKCEQQIASHLEKIVKLIEENMS
jgi:hypothetical protein